jgi:hypothetical protein
VYRRAHPVGPLRVPASSCQGSLLRRSRREAVPHQVAGSGSTVSSLKECAHSQRYALSSAVKYLIPMPLRRDLLWMLLYRKDRTTTDVRL